MKNGKRKMENGEAKAKFGIVCLKWELFLLFPFFIFHSPFLILSAFVCSWQKQRAVQSSRLEDLRAVQDA